MAAVMLIAEQVRQRTRIDVIINAGAGTDLKRDAQVSLAELFTSAGVDANVLVARSGAELLRHARRAVRGDAQTIVAAGGDGTVSAIAAVVAGTDKTLGVL